MARHIGRVGIYVVLICTNRNAGLHRRYIDVSRKLSRSSKDAALLVVAQLLVVEGKNECI